MAGPGYRSDTIFDLSVMQPYSLTDIYEPFSKLTGDMALYLPRTSDVRQLAKLVPNNKKMTAIHYCMEGASKVGYCSGALRKYSWMGAKFLVGFMCIYWRVSIRSSMRF